MTRSNPPIAFALLLGALGMAFAIAPDSLAAQPESSAGASFDGGGEASMMARINSMRAAQNLAPLVRHGALDQAARAHSRDMADTGALTHVSQTTGTPADRVQRAGVRATHVAENVALHRTTAEAQQALSGSDAHRANMLNANVTHIGLASLSTAQGHYVTQVFAAVSTQAPPEAPAASTPPPQPAPAVPAIVPPSSAGSTNTQAPTADPAPRAPVAPAATPRSPMRFQVIRGPNGPIVQQYAGRQLQGYWVYGSGRWWYFPFPPGGARPGQRLQPDLSVTTVPPGFPVVSGLPVPRRFQPAPPLHRGSPPPRTYRRGLIL